MGEAPAAPSAPDVSLTVGLQNLRTGAAQQQGAVQKALAAQAVTDQARQAESDRFHGAFDPLQETLTAQTQAPLPEVAAPPAMPPPPSLEVRPFLSGVPGEDPVQSLNKAVLGLSLLAQMGFGAASGVPELSLRALTGAMQGWHDGDIQRGDREFTHWQATVAQMQKEYDNRRQLVEDIVQRNRGDVERTRIALLTELSRHGASTEELKALTESDQAYFALLDRQGGITKDLGAQESTIALQVLARQMDAQNRAIQLQQWIEDHKLKQAQLGIAQAGEARKGRMDALTERFLTGALSGGPGGPEASGGLPTMPPGVQLRAGPLTLGAPTPSAPAAVEQAIGVGRLTNAGQIIDSIRSDPKKKAEVEGYLGPVGGRASWWQKNVPGGLAGTPPDTVVDLEQSVASYRNYVIKLITGAQMGEKEAERIRQEIPETTDPSSVFWRKYENSKKNVQMMEELVRAGQAGQLPGRPGTTPKTEMLRRSDPRYNQLRQRGMTDEQIQTKYGVGISD